MPTSVTLACARCGTVATPAAAFCSTCGAPLGGTPSAAYTAPAPGMDAMARRLADALGPSYEVGSLLGRGGFAEVYAVRDGRLKRDLAVKVLRPDLVLSPALIDRFRREAETVAALRHPNIIPIFDIGEQAGLVYIVMPLIRGETLRARLQREERIAPVEARRILHESALALAAAHELGIVHRDVKPDNIMLEGRSARVLLMDFGIAKALDAGPEVGLTQTGMALGTPHYMSPEQAFGERTIDGRSDEYSLAVVGYTMLTGQLPFPGDSVGMILKQQIADQAQPLRTLAPDVPDELADALERAMAKDPAGRYPTLEDFAAELAPTAAGADADVLRLPAAPARIAIVARPAVRIAVVALALVAFALYGLLWPKTHPAELVPFSVSREAGLERARAFLEKQGGPRYQKEYLAFARNDSTLQVLRWALGGEGANQWIARHGGYRTWALRWVQPPSHEEWSASIGEGGRVAAFAHVLPDSVRPPEAPEEQARATAAAFLAANGYPAAALSPLEASVDRDRGRTSRQFAWAERGSAVAAPRTAGSRADSAFMRLEVAVEGDRVTRLRRSLTVPEAFRRAARARDEGRLPILLAIVVSGLVAAIGGLVLAARQTRLTALPWRPALGAGLVLGLLFGFGQGVNTAPVWAMEQSPDASWTMRFLLQQGLAQTLVSGLLIAALLVPLLASVIPLLRGTRPASVVGVESLLRGRPRRGALLDACLLGYGLAGAVLLVTLPSTVWGAPADGPYPMLLNLWLPVAPLTYGPYPAVLIPVLVLLGVVVVSRWVRRPALAVVLLALAATVLGGARDGWVGAVGLGGSALVYLAGGWWLGLLPLIFAAYVVTAVEYASSLLALGDVGYLGAGVIAALSALLPLALALVARRDDAPRTPTGATGGAAAPA